MTDSKLGHSGILYEQVALKKDFVVGIFRNYLAKILWRFKVLMVSDFWNNHAPLSWVFSIINLTKWQKSMSFRQRFTNMEYVIPVLQLDTIIDFLLCHEPTKSLEINLEVEWEFLIEVLPYETTFHRKYIWLPSNDCPIVQYQIIQPSPMQ